MNYSKEQLCEHLQKCRSEVPELGVALDLSRIPFSRVTAINYRYLSRTARTITELTTYCHISGRYRNLFLPRKSRMQFISYYQARLLMAM